MVIVTFAVIVILWLCYPCCCFVVSIVDVVVVVDVGVAVVGVVAALSYCLFSC